MYRQLTVAMGILVFTSIYFISCSKSTTNKNPPTPPPPVICDSAGMKYSSDIVPILTNNCYGCHGTGNTTGSAGILLEGYNNIEPYATGGTVKGVITHASGYVGMPYLKPKLDSCTINKILDWISQGAPNN